MIKNYIKTAAYLGGMAVLMGAFGAHALKRIAEEHTVAIFETAVRYQFYHVFALALVSIVYRKFSNNFIKYSGILFISGIVLFSGSLYLLTVIEVLKINDAEKIGIITPIGGLLLTAGWICLGLGIKDASTTRRKSFSTK